MMPMLAEGFGVRKSCEHLEFVLAKDSGLNVRVCDVIMHSTPSLSSSGAPAGLRFSCFIIFFLPTHLLPKGTDLNLIILIKIQIDALITGAGDVISVRDAATLEIRSLIPASSPAFAINKNLMVRQLYLSRRL
jgi:hypothetical protein